MACLYLALDSDEARITLGQANAISPLVRLHDAFAADDAGLAETLNAVFSSMLLGEEAIRSCAAAAGCFGPWATAVRRLGPGSEGWGQALQALELLCLDDTGGEPDVPVIALAVASTESEPHRRVGLECLSRMLAGSEAACDAAMAEGAGESLLKIVGGGGGGEEDTETACLCLLFLLTQRTRSNGNGVPVDEVGSGLWPAPPERLNALMEKGLLPRLLAVIAAGKSAKAPAEQALDVVALSSEENAVLVQSARAIAAAMLG